MGCAHASGAPLSVGVPDAVAALPLAHMAPEGFHGSYSLMKKLERGSVASLHSAQLVASRRPVVVKVSDVRLDRKDASFTGKRNQAQLSLVENEVSVLRRLAGSVHVVTIVEAFLEEGLHYLVTEDCDSSLMQALGRMPEVTESSLRNVLSQMLQGIAAVHQVGLVHRDIKADSFRCAGSAGSPVIKLFDFGLAVALPPAGAPGLKGVYGTAPFMAPEVLQGGTYGAGIDMWSFGVVVYALFFGQLPYRAADSTASAMKAAILSGRPSPSFAPAAGLRLEGSLSEEAVGLVRGLLRREAVLRPTAAQALRHPFFRLSSEGRSGAGPEGSLRPVLMSAVRAGLFDARRHQVVRSASTDVDKRLAALQAPLLNERRHTPIAVDPAIVDLLKGISADSGGSTAEPSLSDSEASNVSWYPDDDGKVESIPESTMESRIKVSL